ncbi:MAG: homoserine dehydrogenase [Kiritimatiellia bacterium]|jgi:homoserine dehydrogenase|nr:homoserine dehydrogenase [Kiritimatiellia bacterium]MDP6630855.1 homoserine dehydrogenase [Kiritimatiellia bacterium]MDP6811266.1 homoserine dehydrogenase [Kiritimatiellia bacterium]MDP7024120.1 homoserine dehydrogenase [Kiritimatiellia bacterium]
MKEIGLGLLGFGTVGAGVVRGLQENGELMASRLGVKLVLRRIADLDLETDRGVAVDEGILTTDAKAVIDDPDVDVVIELVGGTGVAKEFVLRALEQGKPVVTANKALLADFGAEIFDLAREKRTDIYFGASVGGGIPIIRALREGLSANRIQSIHGILNGTCNYILTEMERNGVAFDACLADAQAKGYAEAEPSLDIDGFDTAHKAVILASLAYGGTVPMDAVFVDGIRGLSDLDIGYAHDLGYRVKLLAVIKSDNGSVEIRVHPSLVPLDSMLGSVSGVFNAVLVSGDMTGDTLYYGRGAGADPTASTVLGDVVDVVRNLESGSAHRIAAIPESGDEVRIRPMSEITTRYYVRLCLKDQPGVMAQITSILGEHQISLASALQKDEPENDHVPVVYITHEAVEAEMDAALKEIAALDCVSGEPVLLRIEG